VLPGDDQCHAPALQAAGKSGGGGGAAGGSQQGTGSTSGASSPARRGAGSPAPGDDKGSLAQVSNAHEAAPVRLDFVARQVAPPGPTATIRRRQLRSREDECKGSRPHAPYCCITCFLSARQEAKDQGNVAFKAGDYMAAMQAYSAAIQADPRNPVYYSNRAMAALKARPVKLIARHLDSKGRNLKRTADASLSACQLLCRPLRVAYNRKHPAGRSQDALSTSNDLLCPLSTEVMQAIHASDRRCRILRR